MRTRSFMRLILVGGSPWEAHSTLNQMSQLDTVEGAALPLLGSATLVLCCTCGGISKFSNHSPLPSTWREPLPVRSRGLRTELTAYLKGPVRDGAHTLVWLVLFILDAE